MRSFNKKNGYLLGSLLFGLVAGSGNAVADMEEGKRLSFDRKMGNCLACHMIAGGVSPGDIGPPLIAMKARFPERAVLRAQIWDATVKNPNTIMPPFGRHQALTEEQIDQITDFIWSL